MIKILTLFFILCSFLLSASLSERLTSNLKNINELRSIGYSLENGEVFVVKRDGKYYRKFATKTFTGRAVFINKNNLIKLYLSDGIKDGYFLIFSRFGNLISEQNYKNGKLDGLYIKWDKNSEQRLIELNYKNNLPCEGWIKTKSKNLIYKNCKKSGYEFKMENGELFKIIYEDNNLKEKIKVNKKS